VATARQPEQPAVPETDRPKRSLGRNLPVAIASGVALAVVFLGTLFTSPWVFLAFVSVLVVIAVLELDSAFRSLHLRPATPVVLAVAALLMFGTYALGAAAQALGLVLLLLGSMAWTLLDRSRRRPASSAGLSVLMGVWVPFTASFLALLLARDNGQWFALAAVVLPVFTDIGAYGFGYKLGRRKLAPSVSPGKTWEGTVGGFVTALAVGLLGIAHLPGFDYLTAAVVAVGVAVAGVVGDLAESLVKRDLGIKDLGRVLPGHGGIMDRADAILFALPAAHLLLLAVGA
jgi:phosphatidate cytidylyltransferase